MDIAYPVIDESELFHTILDEPTLDLLALNLYNEKTIPWFHPILESLLLVVMHVFSSQVLQYAPHICLSFLV